MTLSRRHRLDPDRDSGPVVRCARLAAAVIAVLAVHAAVSHPGHQTRLHTAAPWILIVVALGAGAMVREAGRGLARQLPRPWWSARFAGSWAASSGLLSGVLLASGSSPRSGAWIAIPIAVGLGVVLAASSQGARRLLWSLARLRHRIPPPIRAFAVAIPCALTLTTPAPAPLLAGWSDRGPPLRLS